MMLHQQPRARRTAARALALVACAALWLALSTPAGSEEFPLTRAQFGRLMTVVDKRGTRTTLPPSVATMLGLNDSQYKPDIKQAAYLDAQGGRHGFAPFNDRTGFFMFRTGPSTGQTVFHVGVRFDLVKAARSFKKNEDLIALPEDEAQKELGEEFARWARVLTPEPAAIAPPPAAAPKAEAAGH